VVAQGSMSLRALHSTNLLLATALNFELFTQLIFHQNEIAVILVVK
jgi:hypothetical protein